MGGHKGVEFLDGGAEKGCVEGKSAVSRGNRLAGGQGSGGVRRNRFLLDVIIVRFFVILQMGKRQVSGAGQFIRKGKGESLRLGILKNEILNHCVPCLDMTTEREVKPSREDGYSDQGRRACSPDGS